VCRRSGVVFERHGYVEKPTSIPSSLALTWFSPPVPVQ
jgi:hypothetical protein